MKNLFKTLVIVFCILSLVGYGFKLMHWPGAGVMLVVGTGVLLALLIYWFVLAKKSLVNIFFFILYLNLEAAFILKSMHWPGGGIAASIMPITTILFMAIYLLYKEA
jgi:hypothetical protein